MFFTPSRDEARRFFIEVWRKHQAGVVLAQMEQLVRDVLLAHPEYQRYLSEDALSRDWQPGQDETNPFLHFGMHLAIAEQLSIDQPAGVRALYLALCQQLGDEHAARHEMMDGLAEMIWQAQRHHTAPDPEVYLGVLRRKLAGRS